MDLALADQTGEQEQRLLHGSIERHRVAENDFGLLEQTFGGQGLGPAHVGSGKGVPPILPGFPFEELLVELDRLLELAQAKRLRGPRGERVGRYDGLCLTRILFHHGLHSWPWLLAPVDDANRADSVYPQITDENHDCASAWRRRDHG